MDEHEKTAIREAQLVVVVDEMGEEEVAAMVGGDKSVDPCSVGRGNGWGR